MNPRDSTQPITRHAQLLSKGETDQDARRACSASLGSGCLPHTPLDLSASTSPFSKHPHVLIWYQSFRQFWSKRLELPFPARGLPSRRRLTTARIACSGSRRAPPPIAGCFPQHGMWQ